MSPRARTGRGCDRARGGIVVRSVGAAGGGGGELPRPGRGLRLVLIGLVCLWVLSTVSIQWVGADPSLFLALAGNTDALLGGQLWRLLTAPWLHSPDSPWHLLGALMGLYFLAPALERQWRERRLLLFLAACGSFAFASQAVAEALLPSAVAQRLSAGHYFGALPMVEAVAVAWALQFRGQTVRLFFMLPVSAKHLLTFVVGISVLRLIAVQQAPEGLVSPFGGMLAGWLLGGSTPSPLRRAYLRWRYGALQRQSLRLAAGRSKRRRGGGRLTVLEGGKNKSNGSGRDKRTLN